MKGKKRRTQAQVSREVLLTFPRTRDWQPTDQTAGGGHGQQSMRRLCQKYLGSGDKVRICLQHSRSGYAYSILVQISHPRRSKHSRALFLCLPVFAKF